MGSAVRAANGSRYPGPFVFEGNAPAGRERESRPLTSCWPPPAPPTASRQESQRDARFTSARQNSIQKDLPKAVFQRPECQQPHGRRPKTRKTQRQSWACLWSRSLLNITNGSARVRSIRQRTARFTLKPNFSTEVIGSISLPIERPKAGRCPSTHDRIVRGTEEAQRPKNKRSKGPTIYLFIQGLENFKKTSAGRRIQLLQRRATIPDRTQPSFLQTLITEGPSHGIHIIVTCDTFNNVSPFPGSKSSQRIRHAASSSR